MRNDLYKKAVTLADMLQPEIDKDLETLKIFINLLQRFIDVEKKKRLSERRNKRLKEIEEDRKSNIRRRRFINTFKRL